VTDATAVSREEWLRVRRYLDQHRRELTQSALALYPEDLRVAGTPLLARPEWLPEEPLPLDQVVLSLQKGPDPVGAEPAAAASFCPLRPDGTRYATYAAAIADLSRPKLFENRICYRLLEANATSLRFGIGRYFDLINRCEAAAHEYAAATLNGEYDDLPLRAQIGDPTDLTRRPVMAAITALVLIRGTAGTKMILHWRDPAKVATGGGLYTTAPVGMFQPSHDAPWNLRNDFGLWRSLVRELNEELLEGSEDYGSDEAPIDYRNWPLYQQLTQDVRSVCWLGMGFDPLSLVIDMLVVAAFDEPVFDALVSHEHTNDEGRLITTDFTEQNISRLVAAANVEPASAALLRLAWRHRDVIR
jgi:hypothetical protein